MPERERKNHRIRDQAMGGPLTKDKGKKTCLHRKGKPISAKVEREKDILHRF